MTGVRRQPGLVAYADVGCAIWSRTRRRSIANDVIPVGGVVVRVTEKPNPDSGEINRAFLVFDHETTRPRLHWSIVEEGDVERTAIAALEVGVLRRACKDLANEIAFEQPHRQRTGQPSPHEARAVFALAALMEIVAGPEGRDGCQRVLDPASVARMWRGLVEDVLRSTGPVTTATAQRAFAAQELVALIYGDGGVFHVDDTPRPAEPTVPRPAATVNTSALVD